MYEADRRWLADARDTFEDALACGNWQLASDIVQDVKDFGFELEADEMEKDRIEFMKKDRMVEKE